MCKHPRVWVVEVGPLQGSYQATCEDCGATGPEACTVAQALMRF